MAVFSYQALTVAGDTRRGVIDAESRRAAWQALRTRGVFPTDVHEQTEGSPRLGRRVPAAAFAAATRQLATLIGAGVPVADALAASPRVFDPLFRDLVHAGEVSGALAAVLERLAQHTEARAALRARLRAALTYPVVMTAATAGVLGFLLAWVVPQVTRLFADTGTRLPLATRVLVGATDLIAATWWVGLVGLVAAAWAGRTWAATAAGRARLDTTLLRVPLVGRIVRVAAMARLTRTLATLLAGGLPLESALGIAGAVVGNRRLGGEVERVRAAVREGRALAPALAASGMFPALLVQMAAVGERGGDLAPMLERAAAAYESEMEAAVGTVTALVEPALVLVMGGVVLALVTAILLPIFELNTLVR